MNDWRARGFLAAVALVSVVLLARPAHDKPRDAVPDDDPTRLLSTAAPGFARAEVTRPFEFPRDHDLHEDFQTEWWYFTGHLAAASGREFGFQLTLFRFELAADHTPSDSAWRTPRVLLGHFAVSDFGARRFHAFERLARAHPDVAAIDAAPLTIRLDDWRIERLDTESGEHWRVHAAQDDIALSLSLTTSQSPVLQGAAGLSRKSTRAGNASYYYSLPRLEATGDLQIGTERLSVTGEAWLDREWSTSVLEPDQQGWDWFALQLDDGASVMFYQLRDARGDAGPESAGSFVDTDGTVTPLSLADVDLTVTAWWTSPGSGHRYPHGWRLAIPGRAVAVEIKPRLAAQEWRGRFRYWEGAVSVTGSHTGRGYVELTGY